MLARHQRYRHRHLFHVRFSLKWEIVEADLVEQLLMTASLLSSCKMLGVNPKDG